MNRDDDCYIIPLSEIVARFPGHLFWKNKEGVYLGCNLEMALSIGFKNIQSLIGKTDFDLLSQDKAQYVQEIDQYVMKTGQTYSCEETIIPYGQKEEKVYMSKKSPLHNLRGEVIGTIGTAIDITERKKIEVVLRETVQQLERSNQTKNEFIANMSHDLRTPLSGMQALAESMRLVVQDPQLIENIGLLLDASRDLLKLVDNIVDVIRVDANAYQHPDREFKLHALVTNSVRIMQPKIQEKNIHFALHYDEVLPAFLLGQSLMLQRIMINLLSNALKFTPKNGQVKLSVIAESISAEQCTVVITVSDTGIGIPEDKLGEIFDKFSRVSASFKGQYEGTGIGLYMVKRYIEQMHGTIAVKSQENSGTVFTCRIPFQICRVVADEHVPAVNSACVSEYKQYPHVEILLVEDSVIAQKSQSAKFQSLGCRVQTVATAHDATVLFQNNQFDLLVVDLGLPDADGWSLVQRFREEHSNPNSLVPIVILTAHAQEDAILSQNKNHAVPVVFKRKPLMLADAAELLQTCIV